MNKFSPGRRWFFISLALFTTGIYAGTVEHLNFNYKRDRVDAGRAGMQVKACRSLTDPITLRFEVADVDSYGEQINLKINGEDINGIIAPFRKDASFNHPFTISSSVSMQGYWVSYQRITKKNPYCFYMYEQDGSDLKKLIPKLPGSFFCKIYEPLADGPVYNYNNDIKYAPPEVQDAWNRGDVDYFRKHIFYYDEERGPDTPQSNSDDPDNVLKTHNITSPGFFKGVKDVRQYDDSLPFWSGNYSFHTFVSGYNNFTLSQRNIQSVELTILRKRDNKTMSFRWGRFDARNERNLNILRLTLSGSDTELVKPASGQSDESDQYQTLAFYTGKQSFYRGTLVPGGGLTDEYRSHIPPLSLPASIEGDINLVNTDSITLKLKRDNGGNYTAWFYGQPLQFSDFNFAGRTVLTASQVKDTCY